VYDQYLKRAHAEGGMIMDLWNLIQDIPQYRDKTTLIVSCDRGRGDKMKDQCTDHGEKIEDVGQIWIAVLDPDTMPEGLVKTPTPIFQKQIAPTLARLLGFTFVPDKGNARAISGLMQ
jgi:hypothetical protein